MIVPLFYLLLISIGINFFFYFLAATLKTDVFTDITYASTSGITPMESDPGKKNGAMNQSFRHT